MIQRPGADSHARWMSKAIYTLKLTLLQHQFSDIPWHKKRKMIFFIVFVYLESWFCSSSLFTATSEDPQLHQCIQKFSKFRKKRHTCYLTQEVVPLSLFNTSISEGIQNELAGKISILPDYDLPVVKPALPSISSKSTHPDYIEPRSTVLFFILIIPYTYLTDPEWRQRPEYTQVKQALKNLMPVNDSCQRALALATKFNDLITKDEQSYQDLVLVVEAHRKKFNITKKPDLKQLF